MIKVGLIGNQGSIVHQIGQLKNVREIQVIGKSSVGMMEEPQGKYLSIPECNRKELVETSDFLIVEKTQLLLPDLLRMSVRNNKHLFITDLPDIQPEQCADLIKLADEAKTMVHIADSALSDAYLRWIHENRKEPAYINIFETLPELPEKRLYLTRYLFFALSYFKALPQKIRASGIHQPESGFYFINIRLDFPSYSAFNLEMLIQPHGGRHLRIALPGKFLSGDFATQKAMLDQKEITLPAPRNYPVADLLRNFGTDEFYDASNLSLYYSTLLTLRETLRKIELFTPWK